MHTAQISKNLSMAINCLEEILNNQDCDTVFETIKKYKEMKGSGQGCLKELSLD